MSTSLSPGDTAVAHNDGTHTPMWGEPISVARSNPAAPDFPALQRALTSIQGQQDVSDDEDEKSDFNLARTLDNYRQQTEKAGVGKRRLDVAWKDVYVRGVGASAVYGQTVGSLFNPFVALQDKRRAAALERATTDLSSSDKSPLKTPSLGKNERFLLHGFNGVLHSGKMALVLGRPGSGCTTFLKLISNIRQGWAGVDGEVIYGDMTAKEADKVHNSLFLLLPQDAHLEI